MRFFCPALTQHCGLGGHAGKALKVKYLGLSEVLSETLHRAHTVHPITALQVKYSPFMLDIEDLKIALLQTARELGVKIICYAPVGQGLLTGKIMLLAHDLEPTDARHQLPHFSAEKFPKMLKVVESIKAIADKHGSTPGQVAFAWIPAQGDDFLPILGSSKVANIKENMDAQSFTLAPDEVAEIRHIALAVNNTIGPRYPPAFAVLILADTPQLK
ncbi:NADP-dependent oxidoreductase domain-containing protein [Cerioporus squamosus]|nr:NADP-dependent oxidoreductase domain-containing protein [Cerioporus squamosus]